jgi:hypothetical protein
MEFLVLQGLQRILRVEGKPVLQDTVPAATAQTAGFMEKGDA